MRSKLLTRPTVGSRSFLGPLSRLGSIRQPFKSQDKMLWLIVAFLLSLLANAEATVTIRNFNGGGSAVANQVARFDIAGNQVDAHDGGVYQFGNTFYWYGTSYGCGFRWHYTSTSPFCGFKSYSSVDLVNWKDEGYLFDGSGSTWQTRCAPANGSGRGCFRPHVLYNSANNNYVLWINTSSSTAACNYRVFTASAPTGPFTEQTVPSVNHCSSPGDMNLFKDDDGTGYIVYTTPGDSFKTYVEQLTSDYLNSAGTDVRVGTITDVEAPAMFKKGSTYYVLTGHTCPFCGQTNTGVYTASSPLGTYTAQGDITSTSCGGQLTHVSVLSVSGSTVYLFQSDLWRSNFLDNTNVGWLNQGQANYFWLPLAFSGSVISPITCDATFTFELTPAPPPGPAGIDQTTEGNPFVTHCGALDIGSSIMRLQTFTPSRSGTLRRILFTTAQGNPSCSISSCEGVNADLTIDLMSVNQSTSMPTGRLASAVMPGSSVPWSPTVFEASIGIAVTAGTKYGIRVSSQTAVGCYTWSANDQNVYDRGLELYSADGGSSYNIEMGRALKFATVVETAPDTVITSSPPALSNTTSATFAFTSTDPASTFSCSLDNGSFSSCSSPKTYSGLSEGSHNFQVTATDAANNTDPTPASYMWTIDITPPETTITSNPPATTNSTTASFSFTSTETASTFACSLDGSAFATCASPQTYNGLSNGSHTFQVRAIDAAGNFDTTPAKYTWTISTGDITPPDTTITSSPAAVTKQTTAMFKFVSTETGSTFACALDTSAFTPCTSPQKYNRLPTGAHMFQVYAIDAAGNRDSSPATFTWTIQ